MKIYSILMKILVIFFFCNEMGILNIDLENINLDKNVDEDGPDTIILIRLLSWHIKFKKRRPLKKELKEKLTEIMLDFLHVRR